MVKKLTLSLDRDLIAFAHRTARAANDSISNMVGTFFRHLQKQSSGYKPRNPAVRELHGITQKHPLPYKSVMLRRLKEKHS